MIIIEYDYYIFLKSTSKLSAFEKDLHKANNRPVHIMAPENFKNFSFNIQGATHYSLSRNLETTLIDFTTSAQNLLKYIKDHNIKEVTFYSFPLIWLFLLPDLINLKVDIKISKFQPENFLPKNLISALLPFFYQHSLDYLKNFTLKTEKDYFYHIQNNSLICIDDFIALHKSCPVKNISLPLQQTFSETEIIIFKQPSHLISALSSQKDQDISIYLYHPLMKSEDLFLIRKDLFESLSPQDLKLLNEDINYFFYSKNCNITVSLQSSGYSSQEIPLHSPIDSDQSAEKSFIHNTQRLYNDFSGAKK